MLKFSAERYVSLGSALKRMEAAGTSNFEAESKLFLTISQKLEEIGCTQAARAAIRLSSDIIGIVGGEAKASRLEEFKNLITDEMSSHLFLWVPSNRAKWYQKTGRDILGDECVDRFSKARLSVEAEKAAKCFAFGQFTACAFHLMRVTEAGLRAFGAAIEFRSEADPNWGQVFSFYDLKCAVRRKDRTAFPWKEHSDYLEEIGGYLRAVKDAWRNSTMHLERSYDEDDAAHLLAVIPPFMRKLASRIDEGGAFV